jgi:phosphatidylserine/phosphatidylglycerophosphate/cardiolipin synthase-like enzyme
MATFADGKIEAYLGPRELTGKDDLEAVIVDFIAGARKSLDIAVQELDSEPIAQAILDARYRGVDVQMALEQDYLRDDRLRKPRPRPGETAEQALHRTQWEIGDTGLDQNRRILGALLHSAVDVKADYNPKIFHQKFALRDFRERTWRGGKPALLTGSANFTTTDTHSNLNHVFVFHDRRICAEYRREFDEIRRGEFGRRQHGDVPRAYNLAGVPVKVLFAPDHTPELEIMKQILKAKESVVFAIFTFAGSSGIDDAMLMAAAGGRHVRGAVDPAQARQAWGVPSWLPPAANVEVFVPRREGGLRKLHHKLLVVDDSVVIGGSFNYTAPANEYNDENIFVIGSPYPKLPAKEGGPVNPVAVRAIARHMRAEIDRIIAASDAFPA